MGLGALEEKQAILLDLLRASAAFLVLIHHVKNGFFASYASLDKQTSSNIIVSIFYFFTGLGRLPVLLFFVLSGFFISRSILKSLQRNNWSWKKYVIDRAIRLEIVLIPALILTFFWDLFPQIMGNPNLTAIVIPPHNNLVCFIGNLFFLQTIVVDTYGSNFPLWSLSYEFWYYILFPLLLVPCHDFLHKKQMKSVPLLFFALFVIVLVIKNILILKYSLIWLLGSLPNVLPAPSKSVSAWLEKYSVWLVSLLLLITITIFRKSLDSFPQQIFAGFLFMLVIYIIINVTFSKPGKCTNLDSLIQEASGFSYTTYLAHAPLIVFLVNIIAPKFGSHWQPTPVTLFCHLAITLVILLYSYAVASCTEAHTSKVRQFFYNLLLTSKKEAD